MSRCFTLTVCLLGVAFTGTVVWPWLATHRQRHRRFSPPLCRRAAGRHAGTLPSAEYLPGRDRGVRRDGRLLALYADAVGSTAALAARPVAIFGCALGMARAADRGRDRIHLDLAA